MVVTAYVFTKNKVSPFGSWQILLPRVIILGQAIGRWGNFMNQEAHGGEVTGAFPGKLTFTRFYYQSNVY